MRRRNTDVDVTLTYRGHRLRVTGSFSPAIPERGPSYDCGGTPGESACIEDMCAALVHNRADGTVRRRDMPEEWLDKHFDELQDAVLELLSEDAEAAEDEANEARYQRSRGD